VLKPTKTALPRFGDVLAPSDALPNARRVPLDLIDPNPAQPRQAFDEPALQELADSIAAQGVIQPIVVRPVGNRYQIIAGERRTRAARMAGLTDIPALVRDVTDPEAALLTALENLQREDLTIADEGRSYQVLMTLWGLDSQRALAARLGISHNRVSRALRLLPYPALCAQVTDGTLTLRQALTATGTAAEPPPERTDRAELVYHRDTAPDAPEAIPAGRRDPTGGGSALAVTWRPVTNASRALARLLDQLHADQVAGLPQRERAKLAEELAVVEETAAALRHALEAD